MSLAAGGLLGDPGASEYCRFLVGGLNFGLLLWHSARAPRRAETLT